MVEKLKQIYVNARIKGLVIAILHNLQPIIVRMITDEYRNSRWLVYGLENIKLITFYSHRNQNEASVIISNGFIKIIFREYVCLWQIPKYLIKLNVKTATM